MNEPPLIPLKEFREPEVIADAMKARAQYPPPCVLIGVEYLGGCFNGAVETWNDLGEVVKEIETDIVPVLTDKGLIARQQIMGFILDEMNKGEYLNDKNMLSLLIKAAAWLAVTHPDGPGIPHPSINEYRFVVTKAPEPGEHIWRLIIDFEKGKAPEVRNENGHDPD